MSGNRDELFELLVEAEKREIIKCSPSLEKLSLEEACSLDKIIEVTLLNTVYQVTFNYDLQLKVSTKKVEKINRGCTLIVDLLNEIFNSYNILVVPNAKISTNLDEAIMKSLPAVYADYEIGYEIIDSTDSLKDYMIQLGYSIEIKDTISGTMDIQHFLSSCFVLFEDEKPVFNYDVNFTPDREPTKEELKAIENIDKTRYASLIKNIISTLSHDEIKLEMMKNTFEHNQEIKGFFDEKLEIAKQNDIVNPRIDFNIIPVSISLNKVQTKNLKITVSSKKNKEKSASFMFEKFDPFKLEANEFFCPICGERITKDNLLKLLKNKDGKYSVGCSKCAEKPNAPVYEYDGEQYTKDAIVIDPSDKNSYFIGDCKKCDVSGLYYWHNGSDEDGSYRLIEYDELIKKDLPEEPSGYAYREYIRKCPNCERVFAGREDDLNKHFHDSVDGKTNVCCSKCVDGTYSDGPNNYVLSEISQKAFIGREENCRASEYSGKVGEKSEFVTCKKCGKVYGRLESDVKGVCPDCAHPHSGEPCNVPAEVASHLKAAYSLVTKNFRCYHIKNFYGFDEYRVICHRFVATVVLDEEQCVLSSKVSRKGK